MKAGVPVVGRVVHGQKEVKSGEGIPLPTSVQKEKIPERIGGMESF